MNRTLNLITALGASLATANFAAAQTAAAPAAAAPAAAAPSGGPAVVSKVALINFEQVVLASNEGQVVTNLNLAQTALQASAQVFSSLQNDSLLNLLSSTS